MSRIGTSPTSSSALQVIDVYQQSLLSLDERLKLSRWPSSISFWCFALLFVGGQGAHGYIYVHVQSLDLELHSYWPAK